MTDAEMLQQACKIIERLRDGYGTEQIPWDEWEEASSEADYFLAEMAKRTTA